MLLKSILCTSHDASLLLVLLESVPDDAEVSQRCLLLRSVHLAVMPLMRTMLERAGVLGLGVPALSSAEHGGKHLAGARGARCWASPGRPGEPYEHRDDVDEFLQVEEVRG